MNKYDDSTKNLIIALGGANNIMSYTHCVTRLRLYLKDKNRMNKVAIKQLPFIKGVFESGEQVQIIIGEAVIDYTKSFEQQLAQVPNNVHADLQPSTKQKKTFHHLGSELINTIAGIFIPLIPVIIAGGIVLALRNIIGDLQFVHGQSFMEIWPFLQPIYGFFWLIAEAVFFFLPVGVAWSATKKCGGTPILGIFLGIVLILPSILIEYSALEPMQTKINFYNFDTLIPLKLHNQSEVLPALFSGCVLAYIERFFKKIMPHTLKVILVPFLAVILASALAFFLLTPLAYALGQALAYFFKVLLTGPFKILGALLFGLFYAPLVITGIHHTLLAVDLQMLTATGGTIVWPLISLSNIAQGGASIAVYFIMRKKDKENSGVASTATLSAWVGITEPAMYGVGLKFKYPFYAAMIGSGISCMISILFNVKASSIGISGLPTIITIFPQYFLPYTIAMIFAIIIPVMITLFFKQKIIEQLTENNQ